MKDLHTELDAILAKGPRRIVLSAPRGALRRAEWRRFSGGWREERHSATQAFHGSVTEEAMPGRLAQLLESEFSQLTAFTPTHELRLRLSKKGKVLTSHSPLPAEQKKADSPGETPAAGHSKTEADAPHNRHKNYLLPEGQPVPALIDMGVFTPEGRVVKAMYDKYRQVNRFVELVDDALQGEEPGPLRVVDFGCGKSYLTFVLYHFLTQRGFAVEMTGLDLKEDVVAACQKSAERYGYSGLRFAVGDIAGYQLNGPVDIVVTLHACDTATDDALAQAITWGAKRIFSVPCCQHELAAQMESADLSLLTRYGIVKERAAALMTDAIRANLLSACGYKAQVLEFVDMAHTPKNLLIRAVKTGKPLAARKKALEEVRRLADAFALRPKLLGLLEEKELLPV